MPPVSDLPDLDPVIHTLGRLRVVTVLDRSPAALPFPELQTALGMTSGNLSTHLRKLEDAGYVAVAKTFEDRVPVTRIALTPAGTAALTAYRSALLAYLHPDDRAVVDPT